MCNLGLGHSSQQRGFNLGPVGFRVQGFKVTSEAPM